MRLRLADGKFRLVDTGATGGEVEFIFEDISSLMESGVEHAQRIIRERCGQRFDLQSGPLGSLVLVRFQAEEHLLHLRFDHSVSDQFAAELFLGCLADCYNRLSSHTGKYFPPGGNYAGFRSFAGAVELDAALRTTAKRFWTAAASYGGNLVFPGGIEKEWRSRRLGPAADLLGSQSQSAMLARLRERTRLTSFWLILGAVELVVSSWSESFVPIVYHRLGRQGTTSLRVFGSLFETVVTVCPETDGNARNVGEWFSEFRRVNATAPTLAGLWLTELIGYEAMGELRLLSVDSWSWRSVNHRFGDAVCSPAALSPRFDLAPESVPRPFLRRNGVRLEISSDARGSLRTAVQHDQDVIPAVRPIVYGLRVVLNLLLESPGVSVEAVMDLVRATWGKAGPP